MKVGILGGTFDPVHNGHIAIADEGMKQLKLQQVLFLPAGMPWMKSDHTITPSEHRMAMINLAIKNHPRFSISDIEIERKGPTFTAETLQILKNGMEKDNRLYLLMGWDSLLDMPKWKHPEKIAELSIIAAFTRGRDTRPDVANLSAAIAGIEKKLIFINITRIDISSTDIRTRTASGLSIHGMVPDAVEAYISKHGLYRNYK
jgi:nicotinate-nucleotide adenylyltransferase